MDKKESLEQQAGGVKVVLWRDDSPDAVGLENHLRAWGYDVERILTGGVEPILRLDLCLLSGYGPITAQLLR